MDMGTAKKILGDKCLLRGHDIICLCARKTISIIDQFVYKQIGW